MENHHSAAAGDATRRVPVTVLTGFLGAGKTTVLNQLLRHGGRRYAVIVNEYGEIGIDGELVVGAEEEVLELNNGCVCCKVRGDLIRVMGGLLKRRNRFDGILIETTGLADPAPVVQSFMADDEIRQAAQVDGVVCVVDACHFIESLGRTREAGVQLAHASTVILNKVELADAATLAAVEAEVARLNPGAAVIRSARGGVPIEALLDQGAYALDRLELPATAKARPRYLAVPQGRHSDGLECVSVVLERPLAPNLFLNWLQGLMCTRGEKLLRSKGIIALDGDDRRFVFQGVHMMVDGDFDRPWRSEEKRDSRLVFIGHELDGAELQASLDACQVSAA